MRLRSVLLAGLLLSTGCYTFLLSTGCYTFTRMNETTRLRRVIARARFDLNCPGVNVLIIATNNYGATGCGQRAVYALHSCSDEFSESVCTVVLDGPTRQVATTE